MISSDMSSKPHINNPNDGATMRKGTSRIKYHASISSTAPPRTQLCALNAHNVHVHGTNHHRNISNTARESAVIAEWEPVSELQRRIDDGTHYQHFEEDSGSCDNGHANGTHGVHGVEDEVRHRGVFCGYRATDEELVRLKSADPDDYSVKS